MKVFSESGYKSAEGLLLPYNEVKLFDMDISNIEKDKLDKLIKEAEHYSTMDVPFLPASLYRQFFKDGNRANYEALFFRRRSILLTHALAEYIKGEGKYTEKLIDAIWAISEESTWMLPAHLYNTPGDGSFTLGPSYSNKKLHGTALFSATTSANLAVTLLFCRDILDREEPIIAEKITDLLKERAIKSFLEGKYWWDGTMGRRVNNWCPWIISNLLITTAIIEKDMKVREAVVTKAMQTLDYFFDGYAPDGGCDEGPAYWSAAGASLFDCLETIEAMSGGKIDIYSSGLVKNIGEYIVKVNISGNRFVNFADCAPRTTPNPSMLVRFGEKTGSQALISFGKKLAAHLGTDYMLNQSHIFRSIKSLFSPAPSSEDCPLPTSTWLENLELMTAREFPDDKKGMFLAAKGGRNDEMHNHNDCGNFMVYYNAEPVLIDTGVGQYTRQTFSPDRYKLWFMQSGYHNLPSFDGIDQHDGEYYASNTSYDSSSNTLSTQLRHAYTPDAKIKSYIRSMSLIDGVVTVTDDIALEKSSSIAFHFMSSVKPEKLGDGRIKLNMDRIFEYDPSLSLEIEEFDPVGMDTVNAWGTSVLYRIKLSVNTDKCKYSFTIK